MTRLFQASQGLLQQVRTTFSDALLTGEAVAVAVETSGLSRQEHFPASLGLKLEGFRQALTQHFEVLVRVDTPSGNISFLEGVRKLKHPVIFGMHYNRRLEDERIDLRGKSV